MVALIEVGIQIEALIEVEDKFFMKNQIIKKIISFKSEEKAKSNAINLIEKLKISTINKISSVHYSINGTVSFIFENENNDRVSFEIGNNNYSFYTKINNLKTLFFKGTVDNKDQYWVKLLENEVKKI